MYKYKEPLNEAFFNYLCSLNKSILTPYGANLRALRGFSRVSTAEIKRTIDSKGFQIRQNSIKDLEAGRIRTMSISYLSAIADYFGLTVFDMIVSDYRIFSNIPERVRTTFSMSIENASKSILQSRPKRGKYKVRKKRITV